MLPSGPVLRSRRATQAPRLAQRTSFRPKATAGRTARPSSRASAIAASAAPVSTAGRLGGLTASSAPKVTPVASHTDALSVIALPMLCDSTAATAHARKVTPAVTAKDKAMEILLEGSGPLRRAQVVLA